MSQGCKKFTTGSWRPSALHGAFCIGLALAIGSAIVPAFAHGSHDDDGPVVRTDKGSVRGFKKNGVYQFLGIPYAAPPVGNLRWRPPAPVGNWKGTRDATQFGNTCPQVTTLGVFAGPPSITEDCLFLNVFTTGDSGRKKPVIVWIYGGANITGESNDYDGSKLATGGPLGIPTVVVTFNYRMGLFGILSQDHINAEGHTWGNYGILDQQAALRWVKRNIAAFGGDPTNVTLGGQSAGAWDTSAQMISPGAAGLFHRAIIQSFPASTWTTAATALTARQRVCRCRRLLRRCLPSQIVGGENPAAAGDSQCRRALLQQHLHRRHHHPVAAAGRLGFGRLHQDADPEW